MGEKIIIKDLNFYYGNKKQALINVNIPIKEKVVTALIGPSGCGKTTFLRCLIKLRSKVGMVFQKPTPFPMSIHDNIAFGLKLKGIRNRGEISGRVEKALKDSAIFDETKDRLHESALSLSGGQQQRLCIARAVAVEPEVILMDEPCSALDPVATAKIEDLMTDLKQNYTVVIVTHNMQQAARVSEYTGFFMMGEVVEFDITEKIFTAPSNKLTEDYITGRFG